MNKSKINVPSAGTEADSNSTAQNQQFSQPNANTNVSIRTEHQIIDEYYPTINHVELGELYCRDKVILIMKEYAGQFKQSDGC